MIERARLLSEEYEEKVRKTGYRTRSETLKYAITFSEVRSLDLLCKDALERTLPTHPKLASDWFVNDHNGMSSPEDLHRELLQKRQTLLHALNLVNAEAVDHPVAGSLPSGLPKEYQKIASSVRSLFEDRQMKCENYEKNIFIMTRFQQGNKALEALDKSIRDTLEKRNFVGHRADDRVYPNDRNLWDNVCSYMFCCKFGIAVLENIVADEFNPNVALEYGFMRALGKPTLLLKEKRFKPRADILGTVWEEFDILDIEGTIPPSIDRWLRDINR